MTNATLNSFQNNQNNQNQNLNNNQGLQNMLHYFTSQIRVSNTR